MSGDARTRPAVRATPRLLLGAALAGACLAGPLTWVLLSAKAPPTAADYQRNIALDQQQLTAFRQYGMSFSSKMGEAKSVDVSGQFASATIRFHALPDPPEMLASTNIRRWNYSFSKNHLYQVYFVFLVFDQPFANYKVDFVQNDGSVPGVVSDASERTLLLQFVGDPAERSVTINILPR
jgi:hypothetical protein